MTNISQTTVQPSLRTRSTRLLRLFALTAVTLSTLPSLLAQTLQWDTSLSFTGTGNIISVNGATLPTTVTMAGTGTVTATPIGGGQYDVTSVIDVSSLGVALTGTDIPVPSFDVANGGFTYTLDGYTTTFPNPTPGAPLAPGSGYTGTITYEGPNPAGGFLTGGVGPQFAFIYGATEFDLGDGTVPPVASGGTFIYGDSSLSLPVIIGGNDPDYPFTGTASITYTSLNSTVPDSSSILAEALIVLAFGLAFIRLNTPEPKPARVRHQQ